MTGSTIEDGHTHERACLNCGTALVGSHCHECGQLAHVHRTLAAFFHDLLHGVFHFEGKIWRTLPMLAWRPGRLTREYIDGRRASYVSPIALFLFCVFLMFATISLAMPTTLGEGFSPSVATAMVDTRTRIANLEKKRAEIVAVQGDPKAVDADLAVRRNDLAILERLRSDGVSQAPAGFGKSEVKSSLPWLDHALNKARANPDLLIYKLQSSAYKYSWLLIPISVPFVWLLFPFSRRFGLYDHTVFVTYSLCFMTLLVVVLSLMGWAGLPGVALLALGLPPMHLYRQLREGYALGRRAALWRLAALLAISSTTLIMFALAVVGLGVT